MTTIADPELECDLLKKLIKTSDKSTGDLVQAVYDWVGKRLMCPDPGFGHLGPVLEKFCNQLHLAYDEQQALQTKVDITLKMLPDQIQEVERIYNIMRERHADRTDATTLEKNSKLVEWKDARINALKSTCHQVQNELNSLTSSTKSTIMEMIDHVRSGGDDVVVVDDSQCEVLDPALLAEVENMFKDPLPDPSAILRQPTLMLGEPSVETSKELSMEIESEVAGGGNDGEAPTMEILPDNQMGDPTLFPPAVDDTLPMDTSMENVTGGASSIRRLIVPPGHDVPIKQTMVDIFAKQREPQNESGNDGDGGLGEVAAHGSEQPKIPSQHGDDGLGGVAAGGGEQPAVPTPKQNETAAVDDGTLRTPTCEEQALKLIDKLEDGPTKQALMSLCEASLVKVGLVREPFT